MEKAIEYVFNEKTILVVEDDLYNAEYLKEILIIPGLNILHTIYGIEAVQIALNKPVDLVLMDIRLPDIDGYEAIKQIKKQKPELKIIAQTAYASVDEKQRAFDFGANDYISKPLKKENLLAMIKNSLGVSLFIEQFIKNGFVRSF